MSLPSPGSNGIREWLAQGSHSTSIPKSWRRVFWLLCGMALFKLAEWALQ